MNPSPSWITPAQAREALDTGRGRGIKVAVIDSGVELSHPALRGLRLADDVAFELNQDTGLVRRTPGWGIDAYGHGTAIASVIRRVAPEAQIGSFRVLDSRLKGPYAMIRAGAERAIELGYHVINLSLGVLAEYRNIAHFKPWIDAAYRHGVHVVSACSNFNFRVAEWPGHFPSVITVNMARIESDDLLFRWDVPPDSDFAQHLVEFAARGVDVEIAWKDGTTRRESGSSFAAPHVAGLLARLLSRYPALKPPVAKALLQEIARPWTPACKADNY